MGQWCLHLGRWSLQTYEKKSIGFAELFHHRFLSFAFMLTSCRLLCSVICPWRLIYAGRVRSPGKFVWQCVSAKCFGLHEEERLGNLDCLHSVHRLLWFLVVKGHHIYRTCEKVLVEEERNWGIFMRLLGVMRSSLECSLLNSKIML